MFFAAAVLPSVYCYIWIIQPGLAVGVCVWVLKGDGSGGGVGWGGFEEISLYYSRSWISLYILKYTSVNNLLSRLRKTKTAMARPDTPRWERLHQPLTAQQKLAKDSEWLKHMGTSASRRKVAEVGIPAVVSRFLVCRYWFPPCVNVKRRLSTTALPT